MTSGVGPMNWNAEVHVYILNLKRIRMILWLCKTTKQIQSKYILHVLKKEILQLKFYTGSLGNACKTQNQ